MKRYYTIIGTLGWGGRGAFLFLLLLCGVFLKVCLFLIAESRAFRIVFFIQLHFLNKRLCLVGHKRPFYHTGTGITHQLPHWKPCGGTPHCSCLTMSHSTSAAGKPLPGYDRQRGA